MAMRAYLQLHLAGHRSFQIHGNSWSGWCSQQVDNMLGLHVQNFPGKRGTNALLEISLLP